MPDTTVIWSCGHEGRLNVQGNRKQREEKEEWAEEHGICPGCYKERMRAQENAAGPKFYFRVMDPEAGRAHVVCYQGSYPVKDTLKSRGYKFGGVTPPRQGPASIIREVTDKPRGWTREVVGEEEVVSEVEWVQEQGWEIIVEHPMWGGDIMDVLKRLSPAGEERV